MDLDNHIHLRSFVKPDAMPLAKAMIMAILIHLLLVANWSGQPQIKVAEIPNWVNIKLVAGFEETVTEKKINPAVKKQKKKIINEKKITKPAPLIKEKVSKQVDKEIPSLATQATTFVVADSRPYKLDNPKPVYPAAARRRGMQGTVLLSINVNRDGYVDSISITKTSGFKVLDRSAANSVAKWRFVPAKRGNKFVESVVEIPIRFNLDDS